MIAVLAIVAAAIWPKQPGVGWALGLLAVACVVVIIVDVRSQRLGRVRGIFPDVEIEIGGIGFDTRERTFQTLTVPYVVRKFVNVRITNHEPERRVSLSFHCRKPMTAFDGQVDKWPLSAITQMPFDIEPKTSMKTDIEFEEVPNHPGFSEAGSLELDVQEYLSGKRTPLPTIGTWRPPKDGEWTGAFPPPEKGTTP